MRTTFLPIIIAVAFAIWAGAAPAHAQTPVCPAGYYYASDGLCYPDAQPAYPPPVYEIAPPVYQPPIVLDGFGVGIGLGGFIGDRGHGRGGRGGEHGHR